MARAATNRRYSIDGSLLTRAEVVHKYLHLVKYVAGRVSMHLPSSVDINDLINDGVFGLLDAIEKYDQSRSVKFETYAVTRINGAIIDALRSLDWVPRTIRQRARELERAYEELEMRYGRAPTDQELAAHMDLSPRELARTVKAARGTTLVSLEELLPNQSGEGLALADTLKDEESDVARDLEHDEVRSELERSVESLPPQERIVIQLYYFEGKRLREIKTALGVSESRVSQIHSAAVARLKKMFSEP
jgi:RNA polymerase sigma factor for flagellar operon FliA